MDTSVDFDRARARDLWNRHLPGREGGFGRALAYLDLLLRANGQVNLVSRKAGSWQVFEEHILDCALGIPHFAACRCVLDFGTGGGLPGMVLAAGLPDTRVVMLDNARKKIHHLRRIVEDSGFANALATAEPDRALLRRVDAVAVRAVGPAREVVQALRPLLPALPPVFLYKARRERIDEELRDLEGLGLQAQVHVLLPPESGRERHLVELRPA